MEQDNVKLWDRSGFREDPFIRAETLDEASNHRAILPLSYWIQFRAENGDASALKGTGVFVAAGDDIDALTPFFEDIAVIALDLPAYTDGRAYSKAARLKNRGFKGEIRAVGDVLIDQISNLLRSGFDSLEVTHALTKERLEKDELIEYPGFYQPSSGVKPLETQTLGAGTRRLWRNI